jgi:hypothetical protein
MPRTKLPTLDMEESTVAELAAAARALLPDVAGDLNDTKALQAALRHTLAAWLRWHREAQLPVHPTETIEQLDKRRRKAHDEADAIAATITPTEPGGQQ